MTVNVKRRNAECGKLRRAVKRNKITEGIYGSTFLYLKFLVVWLLVMLADFILEFRFEYLWPFWLMMRSVYDSFKYQGLAFSVFFVCIAVTSDMVCYLFIPVQWLFFAASTYVWVQYVWHTDRGICLPTVSLWLLFVYIEAAIRLREFRSFPFHLDLCRPFAAHCIGYPVVTLGFGFKSYISYKMRLRKQKDVQKENDFFTQLLNSALPVEQQQQQQKEKEKEKEKEQNTVNDKSKALSTKSHEEVISNGQSTTGHKRTSSKTTESDTKKQQQIEDYEFIEQTPKKNINDYDESADNYVNDQNAKNTKTNMNKSSSTSKLNSQKDNTTKEKKGRTMSSKDLGTDSSANAKGDLNIRLENDVKRLKTDLQSSRNSEQELRSQVNSLLAGDKLMKSENYQLRQDNENLQNKLHNLVTSRQQDKQSLLTAERKVQEERKLRLATESQLVSERKTKKAEEAAAARAVALAAVARGDCSESCKARRKDLEIDIQQIKVDLGQRDDRIRQLEMEAQSLRQYKEAQNETEVLMSALAAMQDKNQHLENSLSAETRLKLELFSALGDAKRQLEIQQSLLNQKNKEIAELKSKVAEAMALMPSTSSYPSQLIQNPPVLSTVKFCNGDLSPVQSKLNPNAIDYTPKHSQSPA